MLATNCKVPHWLHYNTPYKTLISSALHYPAKPGQMFPKYESWDPMLWYCPLLETDLSSFVNLDEHFKAGQQSNSEVTYLHMVININIFCLLCLAMKVTCGASLPVKGDIPIMTLRTRHSHRQGQTRDNHGQNRNKQGQNRDIMDKSGTVHAGPCFVHDCHSFVHTCPWFVPACTSFILDFLFLSLFVLVLTMQSWSQSLKPGGRLMLSLLTSSVSLLDPCWFLEWWEISWTSLALCI